MSLISYVKHIWNGKLIPLDMATALNHAETGIKTVSDERDKETAAGRAIVEAVDAAEQRAALEVDSSEEVTGKADAAQSAAEATASADATAKANAAKSGAEATAALDATAKDDAHLLAFDHDNIPTAEERAHITAIQGATGTTTAHKIVALIRSILEGATNAVKGMFTVASLAELEAGAKSDAAVTPSILRTWAIKRNKMPDGATPDYTTAGKWASSADGWVSSFYTPSYPGDNVMRLTCPAGLGAFDFYKNFTGLGVDGKQLLASIRCTKAVTVSFKNTSGVIGTMDLTPNVFTHKLFALPVGVAALNFYRTATDIMAAGDYYEFQFVVIGSAAAVSYAVGSLSEEAARVWSEAADAPGVPRSASGTITRTASNPTPGKKYIVDGKAFIFRATAAELVADGDVLIHPSDSATSFAYLYQAIIRDSASSFDASYIPAPASPRYYAPAAHPTVVAANTYPSAVMTITAKNAGERGNDITTTTDEPSFTLSGPTLTGGCSAGAAKMSWLVARGSRGLDAKTTLVGTDFLTLLDSALGFLKKKILVSQFFAADGGTGAFTAVQGNDSRLTKAPASWTPIPQFGGVNDDGTFAITVSNYVISGKKVHLEGRIKWTVKGSKTGTFGVTNVPVAALASTERPIGIALIAAGGASTPSTIIIIATGSTLTFYIQGATAYSAITDANFTASTDIRFFADYISV